MQKIIFNVKPGEISVLTFIKGLKDIKERVYVEFCDDETILSSDKKFEDAILLKVGTSKVVTYNDNSVIDNIIDFINANYKIESIDIYNTEETPKENFEENNAQEDKSDKATNSVETEENAEEIILDHQTTKKPKRRNIGKEEEMLLEAAKGAFDKMDVTQSVQEQYEIFVKDMGINTSLIMEQAFISACNMEKITFHNVMMQVKSHPEIDGKDIFPELHSKFNEWLKNYPELKQECPKISMISMIKVFARNRKK